MGFAAGGCQMFVFVLSGILAACSSLLILLATLTLGTDQGLLHAFAWSHGVADFNAPTPGTTYRAEVYMGLSGVTRSIRTTYSAPSGYETNTWATTGYGDQECSSVTGGGTSMCNACDNVAFQCGLPSIIAVVLIGALMMTSFKRSSADTNEQKVIGIAGSTAGFIFTLISIIAWSASDCASNQSKTFHHGHQTPDVTWGTGPGLSLMTTSLLLTFLNALVHLLVKVEPDTEEEKEPLLDHTVLVSTATKDHDVEEAATKTEITDDASEMTDEDMQAEAQSADKKRKEKQRHEAYQKQQANKTASMSKSITKTAESLKESASESSFV